MMAMRGLTQCEPGKCNTTLALPPNQCSSFAPKFDDAKDGSSCSCIVGYECCPQTCKDAVDTCKRGEKYGILKHDCCGCPTYFCETCPKVNDTCPNDCDEAIRYEDKENGCPYYRCERKKVKPAPVPVRTSNRYNNNGNLSEQVRSEQRCVQ